MPKYETAELYLPAVDQIREIRRVIKQDIREATRDRDDSRRNARTAKHAGRYA